MSESVVDDLEAVEVEHGEAVVQLALPAADGALEPVEKKRAIREICQRVVESRVDELLLEPLALGEILRDPEDLTGAALGVARNHYLTRTQPTIFTTGVHHPVFGLERVAVTHGVEPMTVLEQAAEIVGMHDLGQKLRSERFDLLERITQGLLIRVVDQHMPVLHQIVDEEKRGERVAEIVQEWGNFSGGAVEQADRKRNRTGLCRWSGLAVACDVDPKADALIGDASLSVTGFSESLIQR
jgi:hypothetical protein